MDDIWRKAAKKIRENDRRVTATHTSQPEVKPTVIATSTAVPTYTNTSAALNTVAQCDTRLLQMEFEWKLNRSGPFPHGIRNAIANLRAALVIREAEASKETTYETTTATISAPANAATTTSLPAPANTAAPTTTTTDSSTATFTETMMVAMAATVKLHETTQDDSEEHEGSEETRRDEIGEENNGEEVNEREAHAHGDEQQELEDGECGIYERTGLELGEDKVHELREPEHEPTSVPVNQTTPDATPDELRQFDWANDNDKSIGPVPRVSDFRTTTTPQPVCTPPKPTVTPSNGDVAPSACTPATDAPTTPRACTPVSPNKYPAPVITPPQVPTERAPTAIVHGPRDLSALRSDVPNPWRSLRRRHGGRYSHTPRQFSHQRQHLPTYPTNTHIHTPSASKSHTSDPTRIFETIRHPLGIGPTKPVIRVPTSMAMDTPMHTIGTPRTCSAVIKSVPRSPQVHSMVTVQCQCGRLVPVSDTPHSRTIALCHALTTFISRITSYPLFFPAHFFSCLRFG